MMLTAMAHGKHMYGQKPLVHQLDELRMIREGLAARPDLVTQMGNQRACLKGRMQAVEMLRRNQLGRPIEAHVWTGGITRGHYFRTLGVTCLKPTAPDYLNWNLWRGPIARDIGYHEDLAPDGGVLSGRPVVANLPIGVVTCWIFSFLPTTWRRLSR